MTAAAFAKLCLLCFFAFFCFGALAACGGDAPDAPVGGLTSLAPGTADDLPSANRLLRGLRASDGCDAPPVLFFYGEKDYGERFEGLYHCAPDGLKDGAIALSDRNTADEVALFLPRDEKGKEQLMKQLRDHLQEEISVYESYSPTDVSHLKNALLYTEKDFVILIVSGDSERIRRTLTGFLNDPSGLPTEKSDDLSSGKPDGPSDGSSGSLSSGSLSSGKTDDSSDPLPSEPSGNDTPVPPAPAGVYAYPNDLPENGEKSVDYLADALFIGDSRMEDLLTYLRPKNAGAYAYSALSVSAVFTKNLVKKADGSSCTIAEELRRTKPSFSKCYLSFGLNEIGWPYLTKFSAEYEKVISLVRELNPDCTVYLMNIYPVTAAHSAAQELENNENIRRFNDCIAALAEKTGTGHLNLAAAVCDETGALPEGVAGDGVHGNVQLCRKILSYMLTHTVR